VPLDRISKIMSVFLLPPPLSLSLSNANAAIPNVVDRYYYHSRLFTVNVWRPYRILTVNERRRAELLTRIQLARIPPSLPPNVPHVNRYQARLVTCGNRDNYNVSAEFRYGEGGASVMVEPPPLSKGPSGGNSTLTLAPLPSNHPQSVFQSVLLLFNYPFKACNLLLRGINSLVPVIFRWGTTRTMMTSWRSEEGTILRCVAMPFNKNAYRRSFILIVNKILYVQLLIFFQFRFK